jgi:hypothetical protein
MTSRSFHLINLARAWQAVLAAAALTAVMTLSIDANNADVAKPPAAVSLTSSSTPQSEARVTDNDIAADDSDDQGEQEAQQALQQDEEQNAEDEQEQAEEQNDEAEQQAALDEEQAEMDEQQAVDGS